MALPDLTCVYPGMYSFSSTFINNVCSCFKLCVLLSLLSPQPLAYGNLIYSRSTNLSNDEKFCSESKNSIERLLSQTINQFQIFQSCMQCAPSELLCFNRFDLGSIQELTRQGGLKSARHVYYCSCC